MCYLATAGSYVAAEGATAQVECPPGARSDDGATECTPCEAGSYGPDAGLSECTPANGGYYAAEAGATAQIPCATPCEIFGPS